MGPDRRILRASDAEREAIVQRLKESAGEGRLGVDELAERVGAALSAKTYGELDDLVADLPRDRVAPPPVATPPAWPVAGRPRLLPTGAWLLVMNVLIFGFLLGAPGHPVGSIVPFLLLSALVLARRTHRRDHQQRRDGPSDRFSCGPCGLPRSSSREEPGAGDDSAWPPARRW